MVFIKDLVVARTQSGGRAEVDEEEGGAKVEGTGSGFVWDSAGHIVSTSISIFGSNLSRVSEEGFVHFGLLFDANY